MDGFHELLYGKKAEADDDQSESSDDSNSEGEEDAPPEEDEHEDGKEDEVMAAEGQMSQDQIEQI